MRFNKLVLSFVALVAFSSDEEVVNLCHGFAAKSSVVRESSSGSGSGSSSGSKLFCGSSCEDFGRNVVPSSPLWTSRRGMLAATASSLLLPSAAALATRGDDDESVTMALPDPRYGIKQAKQLAREANLAASKVTQENIDEYLRIGVTKVSNVIPQHWLEVLREEGCELAQDEASQFAEYLNQPTDSGIFFTDLEMARRLPLFSSFALYGPAAAVAGTVMQSSTTRYLYDQLFVKEQGVTTETPWHQDGGYWRVKGNQVASVFVPMDPVSHHDCLQFVKGSHTWPLHNPQHFADGTPYVGTSLPQMPDITQLHSHNQIQYQTFQLQPGDALVFSAKTVHGGPGNWGRALSTRWVGDDARFWDRPGEGAVPTGNVRLQEGDLLAQNNQAFPTSWQQKA